MIIPPLTWLMLASRLTTRPQSCTQTILLTLTNPVSVSTSTSAICTPPTPRLESPSFQRPRATTGFIRRRAVAARQFSPVGSDMPEADVRSASALWQASNTAGATEAAVVLPPLPPDGGNVVSPILTEIAAGSRPNTSAATIAISVFVPVPRSCVPQRISTLPSGLIRTSASEPRPPPPQVAPAQPTPVFTGPSEEAGERYLTFHPKRSAAILYCWRRTSDGSFLIRNSTGSMPRASAISSMIDSIPNDAWG